MSLCALRCEDLLGYGDSLAGQWREWFELNAGALDAECDIASTGTVRKLVQHIFAVELRFAQRLLEEEITPYEQLVIDTLEELFAIHTRAAEKYARFLGTATESAMVEVIEVKTRSGGTWNVSRRTIFVHSQLHSARTWAQLSTLVREAGYPAMAPQDYLLYGMVKPAV